MTKTQYYYYFKPGSGVYQNAHRSWVEISKFADDSEAPLQTYKVVRMHGGRLKCDCPANYRKGAPMECKHCKMVRDWEKASSQTLDAQRLGLYFDTSDNTFHEIPF